MTINDILNTKGRRVETVASDSRLRAAMAIMHRSDIGSVVVLDETGEGTLGIISQDEILAAFAKLGASALDERVRFVMTDALYCSTDEIAEPLMERMTRTKNRHAIVIDQHGAMQGLVSIGDLVASRMRELQTERMVLRDMARSRMLAG